MQSQIQMNPSMGLLAPAAMVLWVFPLLAFGTGASDPVARISVEPTQVLIGDWVKISCIIENVTEAQSLTNVKLLITSDNMNEHRSCRKVDNRSTGTFLSEDICHSFYSNYTEGDFNFTVFAQATDILHDATLSCSAFDTLTNNPQSASSPSLYVRVPPTNWIEDQAPIEERYIESGSANTIDCLANNSRPNPRLTWLTEEDYNSTEPAASAEHSADSSALSTVVETYTFNASRLSVDEPTVTMVCYSEEFGLGWRRVTHRLAYFSLEMNTSLMMIQRYFDEPIECPIVGNQVHFQWFRIATPGEDCDTSSTEDSEVPTRVLWAAAGEGKVLQVRAWDAVHARNFFCTGINPTLNRTLVVTFELQPELCQSAYCLNGGTCEGIRLNQTCLCHENYTGIRCDTAAPCDSSICYNNGECIGTVLDEPKCNCTEKWEGDLCNIAKPCEEELCHNGICVGTRINQSCVCDDVYEGPSCDIVKPCNESDCLNGQCVGNLLEQACACYEGWLGEACEIEDVCHPEICHNGGTCSGTLTEWTCDCPEDWQGDSCDEAVTQPSTSTDMTTQTQPSTGAPTVGDVASTDPTGSNSDSNAPGTYNSRETSNELVTTPTSQSSPGIITTAVPGSRISENTEASTSSKSDKGHPCYACVGEKCREDRLDIHYCDEEECWASVERVDGATKPKRKGCRKDFSDPQNNTQCMDEMSNALSDTCTSQENSKECRMCCKGKRCNAARFRLKFTHSSAHFLKPQTFLVLLSVPLWLHI